MSRVMSTCLPGFCLIVHSCAATNQKPACLLTQLLTMTPTNKFPSLGNLLVKLLPALGVVERVAEAVAAALPHPDTKTDALRLLLEQHLDPVHGAGGQRESRLKVQNAGSTYAIIIIWVPIGT